MSRRTDSVLSAGGSLDPDFGDAGKVAITISGERLRGATSPQPDGTMLSVGAYLRDILVLARHLSDGTPDRNFGNDGIVRLALIPGAGILNVLFALQNDGRVVVFGTLERQGEWVLFFARLWPDGRLDTTFGAGGTTIVNLLAGDDEAHALAVQPDGKIVATARVIHGFNDYKEVVLRLTASGALDPTFGLGGMVVAGPMAFRSVLVQQDGSVVVGGDDRSERALIARYCSDGTVDSSFGVDGFVTIAIETASYSQIHGLALQPDGKVVAAGMAEFAIKGRRSMVARIDQGGNLDVTFNGGKPHVTGVGLTEAVHSDSVAIQPDAKIVASSYGGSAFNVIRYLPGGRLDADFGENGKVTTEFAAGGKDYVFTHCAAS